MGRLLRILLPVLLIFCVCTTVHGAQYASEVRITATVNPDESCYMSVQVTIHADGSGGWRFPVPAEAQGISLNGGKAKITTRNAVDYIDLSGAIGGFAGDFSFNITYTLPDVISSSAAGTQLKLPLLSGFEFPISQLHYAVTLPGKIDAKPAFTSGYHQANIEKDLENTVFGQTVTGSSTTELKDHETLTMTLLVEDALFPHAPVVFHESPFDDKAMFLCGLLAVLYWLVFLRFRPRLRRSTTPPEGITAGQLGTVLKLGQANLSLMVLSWAQLGYVQLRQDRHDRILIIKQMDMGNERNVFEQKCFRTLFSRRDSVDTAGSFYAGQCRAVWKMNPGMQSLVEPRSGNPRLFRALAALVGLFCGVSFGIAISQGAALQGLWIFLLAVLGLVCGYMMQNTTMEIWQYKTGRTTNGLIFSGIWLVMGLLAGQHMLAVKVIVFQWICGFAAALGGRRTLAGKSDFAQILGLRKYMRTLHPQTLRQIAVYNPEYFFELLPYALALGVEKPFARAFGKAAQPACPYILLQKQTPMSAAKWGAQARQLLRNMNQRSDTLLLERILGILHSSRK